MATVMIIQSIVIVHAVNIGIKIVSLYKSMINWGKGERGKRGKRKREQERKEDRGRERKEDRGRERKEDRGRESKRGKRTEEERRKRKRGRESITVIVALFFYCKIS